MRRSRQPVRPTIFLQVECLEDRTAPAGHGMDTSEHVANRILVSFAPDTPVSQREAILSSAPHATDAVDLGFGIYRVELASGTDWSLAASYFTAQPDVASAAPDRIVQLDRTPSDPGVSDHWALQRIQATAAWSVSSGTGQTLVAIIDSGIDYTHPDLMANLWRNPGEIAGNGIDDDGNGFADDLYGVNFADNTGDPFDFDGHGTHVAGIIGAVGNNGIGGAGINWNARIMGLRFLSSAGTGYTSDAVRALNYAVENGARVVNMSWGGPDFDPTLQAAIGRARDAGVIIVAAAGNNGQNTDASPFYPGGYTVTMDNVVAVAATDRNDALAPFSNYGAAAVSLAAPGTSITSTLPGGRYAALSGTSMATPFVTGAIALLWDTHPTWSYQQVIQQVLNSVDPLPDLAGRVSAGGRLNLARMLGVDTTIPPVVPPNVPPAVPPSVPPSTPGQNAGPRVTHFYFAGDVTNTYDRLRITFDSPIDVNTLTSENVVVLDPAGQPLAILGAEALAGSNNTRFDVRFASSGLAGWYNLAVGPAIRDTANRGMDQNQNGIPGEPDDIFRGSSRLLNGTPVSPPAVPPSVPPVPPSVPPVPPPPPSATGRYEFAFAEANPIPDAGVIRLALEVPAAIRISDLQVRLNITHTYVSDLVIRLTSPEGQSVLLVDRRGGSGQNFAGTFFADSGMPLRDGQAPFAGTFRPEEPLAAFQGMLAQGTWTLTVEDRAGQDTGTVQGVTLSFAGVNVAPTVDANPGAENAGPTLRLDFLEDAREDIIVPPEPMRPETRLLLGDDVSADNAMTPADESQLPTTGELGSDKAMTAHESEPSVDPFSGLFADQSEGFR